MEIGGIEIPLSRAKICLILDDKKDYLFYDQKLTKQELCNSAERLISKLERFINKIPQNETSITFENVSSNILHNDKGEPAMLNLYPLITAENRASVDEIYKTVKNVKVDIVVRWEK